jgi:hypothetical protein
MKIDSNLCPECENSSPCDARACTGCGTPLVLPSKGSIALWRLGDVRADVLDDIVRVIRKSLKLPVVIQPSLLDPRPSLRPAWRGVSATAFLNLC